MVKKVNSQHPGDREHPHLMWHVLEHLIVKQSRKRRGSLRVARRADPSLTAGERQKSLEMTLLAAKPSEASFSGATIQLAGHHLVDEASPKAARLFKMLLPKRLHLLVVCLEKLIPGARPGLARSIQRQTRLGLGCRGQLHTNWSRRVLGGNASSDFRLSGEETVVFFRL